MPPTQPSQIAMKVVEILAIHSGPLAARLALAIEKAHVYVQPPANTSFIGLSEDLSLDEETRDWLGRLDNARLTVGGFWANYTNAIHPDDLQILASQILGNALMIAGGRPASVLDDPPTPREPAASAAVGDFRISGLQQSPLFRAPDWLQGDGGYSTAGGRFPLPDDRLERGRRLMRALQQQVRECFESTVRVEAGADGSPGTEIVAIKSVGALVLIQSLNELFEKAYPRTTQHDPLSSPYVAHVESDPEGVVVSGFKLIRNAEIHDPAALLELDPDRMITAFFEDGTQGFRAFPRWPAYSRLPSPIQTGTGTNQRHHDNYSDHVAGRLLVETLLDAMKFLLDCDSRTAKLVRSGEPMELPLECFPLPVGTAHGYERPHPYWPTFEQHNEDGIAVIRGLPPTGESRIVVGLLKDEAGECIAVCGDTRMSASFSSSFTETPEQVARDISELGVVYVAQKDDEVTHLAVEEGRLMLDSKPIEAAGLVNADDEDRPWRFWFDMTLTDAAFYRQQRRSQ